jgi:hypothetical protein
MTKFLQSQPFYRISGGAKEKAQFNTGYMGAWRNCAFPCHADLTYKRFTQPGQVIGDCRSIIWVVYLLSQEITTPLWVQSSYPIKISRLLKFRVASNKKGATEHTLYLGATRLRLRLQARTCPKRRLMNQTSIFSISAAMAISPPPEYPGPAKIPAVDRNHQARYFR